MSLLNATLALGALAFMIPLVIHLLFRNRFKTVDWGAMYLLTHTVVAKKQRFQLTDLLLLLVRCLIPILLAICLARPVLTDWNALPGDAPQSLIIVMDDSRSMSAKEPNDVVRFDKARQQLGTFLQQQSRRDEVVLVTASRFDEVPPKMGVHDAIAKLDTLVADKGPVDVGRMVKAGLDAALNASHPRRHVIVVSDFQTNIVDDAVIEAVDATAAAVQHQPIRPAFSFWNIADDTEKLRNVSVDAINVDAPAVLAERATPVDVRIRNASDFAVRGVRLVWSIDDEPVHSATINLEPRSSVVSRTSLKFNRPGSFRVTVAIEHDDTLIADNRRTISVDVLKQVNLLLVSGDPNPQPLKGETDYLAIALSPFSFAAGDRPDPIHTEVVSSQQFERRLQDKDNLSGFNVIVLANVKSADPALRSHLSSFVSNGGALAIFDGEQIDPDSYNAAWGEDDSADQDVAMRLPAKITKIMGDPKNRVANPFRIGQINQQYSPWRMIANDQQSPLSRVEVYAYRKLVTHDDKADPGVRTLASMAGGDPLVMMRSYGRGQVAQFAIPCDSAWTSLPIRQVFVPMMQQVMMDLAGGVGRDGNDLGEIPAEESELRDVDPDRLKSVAEALGGGVFANVQALQSADQTRRFGREVWRWLLWLLLAALVGEVILQQRRSRPSLALGAT